MSNVAQSLCDTYETLERLKERERKTVKKKMSQNADLKGKKR